MSLTKQDKEDIKGIVREVVTEVVDPRFEKLERKMDAYHTVTINHHLETRSMIGKITKDHSDPKEKLAKAVR